tara:strand:- start:183 stop:650 length:468 start_codon:yes stop_codon:yes gene_type:complete
MTRFTLFFIFFYFIFNIEGNAFNKLKGINEVDLLVEVYGDVKVCSIKEESIVTNVKYILQNSKIKIKKDDAYVPMLYVSVGLIRTGATCTGDLDIKVQVFPAKDPLGFSNGGYFVYYVNGFLTSGGTLSEFAKAVDGGIETMMKELVVKHHEDNQ